MPTLLDVVIEAQEQLLGQLVDRRYRVLSHIADGGMASVYVAEDIRLQRNVALKVMRPELTRDPTFVQRFHREARSAAQLSHPNVVAVHDQGEDGPLMYLIMEFVPGLTLRCWLHEVGVLTIREALTVAEAILAALGAAHRVSLMHRDIKPENILIGDDGHVKVADFGLARLVSSATNSQANGVLGTVAYLSPEQVESGQSDARSDVYSAGLVLFEMLTGMKAVQGDSPIHVAYQHVHGTIPAPSEYVPSLPPDLDAVVAWATQRDPEQRPSHAMALLERIVAIRQSLPDERLDERPPIDHLDRALGPAPRVAAPSSNPSAPATSAARSAQPGQVGVLAAVRRWSPGQLLTRKTPPHTHPTAVPTPGRKRSLRVVAVLSALALIAVLVQWFNLVGPAADRTVPTVAGGSVAAAQEKLRAVDLEASPTEVFDDRIPAGIVIGTTPAANDTAKRGDAITVMVSKGPEKLTVPDVRGKPYAEASELLARAKLARRGDTNVSSETVPKGHVIEVSPPPGTATKKGALVTLTVSTGPAPVPASALVGKPFDAMVAKLKKKNINLTQADEEYSSRPKGTIIALNPSQAQYSAGESVAATVSKGPKPIPVPEVSRRSAIQAVKMLKDAGLKVKVVGNRGYPLVYFVARGTNPAAGTDVLPGSTVTLTVTTYFSR